LMAMMGQPLMESSGFGEKRSGNLIKG